VVQLLVRKRRFRITRREQKRRRVFFLIAVLLLGCILLLRPFEVNWGTISLPGPLRESGLYTEVFKATLPGFRSSREEPEDSSHHVVNKTLLAMVDINPMDPRTFLSTQIPGMRSFRDLSPPPEFVNEEGSLPQVYPALLTSQETSFQGGDFHGGVFIYHAHTTESFVPTSGERFTTDLSQTVAFLGQELKLILEGDYGVPVLHDTTIHDIPRSQAYREARITAQARLDAAKEVRLVVDLHRDGVARRVSTAEINGEQVGKILLVVGSGHKDWQENMQNAKNLHEALERIAPGISRGISEKNLVYNQDLHPGALLVEVGGHENSLEEARRTLPYLARALAEIIYQMP